MAEKTPSEAQTSEEIAYNRLRYMILHGELPVGEFLPQRMLAEKAEASLVTVRTALRSLENDGLIENVPRWGVRIPVETEDDIKDRFFFRKILEVAAAGNVALIHVRVPNRPPDCKVNDANSHRILMDLATRCDSMFEHREQQFEELVELHWLFHRTIARCASAPMVTEQLESFSQRAIMLMNAKRLWMALPPGSFQHVKLIEDIFSDDVGRAKRAMRRHLRNAERNEIDHFRKEHPK